LHIWSGSETTYFRDIKNHVPSDIKTIIRNVARGKYVTKFRAPRSIPARDVNRLSRNIRVVIAGNEFKFNPCNFSIIFPAKLKERKQYKDDKTEGISMNKFADKSKETKFGAKDVHAGEDKVCNEQSGRERYFKHCHFSSGRVP